MLGGRISSGTLSIRSNSHGPKNRAGGLKSDAAHLLWNQIWYNRHLYFRALQEQEAAKEGREPAIAGADAAKRVEKEFGIENLGPWTDFEWGMIKGKLSALNWLMGEEWYMLDT